MKVCIEKFKGYTPIEMHRAIWNKELDESEFDAWIQYMIGECVRICESGNATQMTSNGAADAIRQRFNYE
jgi:hypothetical protein